MQAPNTSSPDLCVIADFSPLLPVKLSRRQIMRMVSAGKFPRCARASKKSEPLFLRSQITDWYIKTFADVLNPERIKEFEKVLKTKSTKPESRSRTRAYSEHR
jgi:hypothetical protein